MVSAGAAVAAVAPNTIWPAASNWLRDVAGREKGVDAALAVDDAAQLGLRERDAPIEQADAGQRPGSGQHAAAGSEIGAVGHVVLGI
ncbi:hypothetical protein G6F65_020790 [Rhizopus arrhizus]|nr:hypothetical protein G6F65_020790 [Rhizopus arrhizus]